MKPTLTTKKFLIIGAITLFMLYGIKPIADALDLDKYRYNEETRTYADQIEAYSPDALRELIAASNAPVLVHFYASWCPYCQKQNPIINELIRDHPELTVRAISVDDSKYKLAQYLQGRDLAYDPYIMSGADYPIYQTLLQEYGVNYTGYIPYTVLLDGGEKPVAELRGLVDKAALEAAIK